MRDPQVSPQVLTTPATGESEGLLELSTPERLDALRQTGLFDSHPDGTFDRYTRIAARLLSTPISLVTLLDDQRQFFAGAAGPGYPWQAECSTALTHSLCKFVAAARTKLALEDARVDPRFNTCGAVQELRVVAYLGVPIVTPDAEAIGSFCVIDNVPHAWSQDDVQM
ncbi:MAG: GAF domain-containing protein, partial [Chthoniobacteraceae bacterium]